MALGYFPRDIHLLLGRSESVHLLQRAIYSGLNTTCLSLATNLVARSGRCHHA
jgi:hypothetical protein